MSSDLLVTLEYQKPKLWLKIFLWTVSSILIGTIALFIYFNLKINKFIKSFANSAQISQEEIVNTGTSFIKQFQDSYQKVDQLPKKTNFLVLGTDKLSGRDNDPELTDTIMVLQLDFEKGKIKTLSFPRDLYNEAFQSKINALYYYGKEKYPNNPEKFTREVLEQMTNLKIDYDLVLGIEDLAQLIEIVDGVEVEVPTAFTDPLFPVPGIDVSQVRDPKILYEEISFNQGWQKMDGTTALKYMRSRHSKSDEGTDEARAQRQQLVLQALFNKIIKVRDPNVLGKLYHFYLTTFAKDLTLEDISRLGALYMKYLENNQSTKLTFENYHLAIYPQDPEGIIYNPPLWQTKQQWIYQIKDQAKFNERIDAIFN